VNGNVTELDHHIPHQQTQVIARWTTVTLSAKENNGSTKSNRYLDVAGNFNIGGKGTVSVTVIFVPCLGLKYC